MNTPDSQATNAHDPRLSAALDALRQQAPSPPPLEDVQAGAQRRRAASLPSRSVAIASVATLIAALIFVVLTLKPALGEGRFELARVSIATLVPAAVLGWALALLRQRRLGAQLLTRAIWWSNLIVGVLIASNFPTASDRWLGACVGFACALSLFVLGSKGLDARDPDHPFSPVRFRGLLLLALVMAFADAQTLLFSAVMQLRVGTYGWSFMGTLEYAGPTIFAAALMTLTVWGIYRLRTWALLLNLVANFAIAYFALEGTLNLSPSVGVTLAATAAVQAFVPVPILAAALGDRNAGQPLLGARAPLLMRVAFVSVALWGAAAAVVFHSDDGWVTGPGRAFHRGHAFIPSLRALTAGGDFSEMASLRRDWRGLDGTGANLRNTDVGRSNLRKTVLVEIDGRGTDFRRAKLTDANFRGANLRGALFSNILSELRGTDFTDATCPDGSLSATARGCDAHLGLLKAPLPRRTYLAPDCIRPSDEAELSSSSGHLSFLGDRWVQQSDGTFLSRRGSLQLIDEGQAIVVETQDCEAGRFELRPEPAQASPRVSPAESG